jgi:hypothetical protein
MACSGFVEPLNLQCWLVGAFAGSMEIFMFIALIFIAGMAAYFRMLNATMLIMFGIFGLVMAQFFTGIYFLVILID